MQFYVPLLPSQAEQSHISLAQQPNNVKRGHCIGMGTSEDAHAHIWHHHIKDTLRGIVSFQERVLYSCIITSAWTGLLLMVILIPSLREELLHAFYRSANRSRKNYVHKSQIWNLPRMIGNITNRPLHWCMYVEILPHRSGPHCITLRLQRPKAELVWYVKSCILGCSADHRAVSITALLL